MATKQKPGRRQETTKPTLRDAKGAIPCLLLVIGAILLLGMLFAAMLQSAS